MMLYQEGDKGQAICRHCEKFVTTTFESKDVPFSDGLGTAHDILVSACDNCGEVIGIPARSTPAVAVRSLSR
jgi:hypothetical protein